MSVDILKLIQEFDQYRVAVIGEAMLDSYLQGESDRICREAPVPVVVINQREDVPGGAANTAVNLKGLGADVIFLSVIGKDANGRVLEEVLRAAGINTDSIIRSSNRVTLSKQRVLAGTQMVVRFDQGTTRALNNKLENELIKRLTDIFVEVDALIISDYCYGILSPRIIQVIGDLQRKYPRVIVADSKNLHKYRGVGVTAVKPNYTEALQLLGSAGLEEGMDRIEFITSHGKRILDLSGAQIAAVTIDEEGALIFEDTDCVYRTYAHPAPHSRAAGAGDTFISAFTLALVAGGTTSTAAEVASAAASVVVRKDGTSTCTIDDLKLAFTGEEKFVTDAFYLAARLANYHQEGKRIVFTNGCFDILHSGHINYLNRAKSLGDVLIIGINTDASVKRLKGDNRPINSLEERGQILAALSCVDHIIPFDGDTPEDLIRSIRPDIYVKGGDYTHETLPEASVVKQMGGKVEILPYLENHSTTGVIERIRKLYTEAG